MRPITAFHVGVVVLLSMAGLAAQQPVQPSYEGLPDISGVWNRLDTVGGGSYGGISAAFPTAELFPEYAAKVRAELQITPREAAAVANYDIRNQADPAPRCGVGGGMGRGNPTPSITSGGMSISAARDLVLMLHDGGQGARYIFADGRPFPSNITGLYSIGRWENGAFVATTRGFVSGMTGFGRGWSEPSTELIETFKPAPDGKRMTITYEWRDPKIYVKPLVYNMVFERLPAGQQIFETWCDSRAWIEENSKGMLKPRPDVP